MLHTLVPYARGFGVDARWLVVGGDPAFFEITKRLCNCLYGIPGDGGGLGGGEDAHYGGLMRASGELLEATVRPGDVVVLHDPQTAGLAESARRSGATVVWRCHIGHDAPNEHVERAWAFLRPYLEPVGEFVFSIRRHVPDWVPDDRVTLVAPSIDPFTPKNCDLPEQAVEGMVAGWRIPTDVPLVLQLSRWDRLKDMPGVLEAFCTHGPQETDARLALVGPEVAGVADDPEGEEMFEECRAAWEALPSALRDRVHLVCLPMDDLRANALAVNAFQRHATVVVQKSLAEGFGLTVTEAMWKARPVVASAVGGIREQIAPGVSGVLLDDPADVAECGRAVAELLDDDRRRRELGEAARGRVRDRFLNDRHLLDFAHLVERLLEPDLR